MNYRFEQPHMLPHMFLFKVVRLLSFLFLVTYIVNRTTIQLYLLYKYIYYIYMYSMGVYTNAFSQELIENLIFCVRVVRNRFNVLIVNKLQPHNL